MYLTEQEAKVVELLKAKPKRTVDEIRKILRIKEDIAKLTVRSLMGKEAIKRIKPGLYEVLIDSYEVIESVPVQLINYKPIDVDTSKIPQEVKEYIIAHEPYRPRSWLARKLNIPKILINQVLYEEKARI